MPAQPITETVVLVNPLSSGAPLKREVVSAGYDLVSIYTLPAAVLAEDPRHTTATYAEVVQEWEIHDADPARIVHLLQESGRRIVAVIPASEPAVLVADEVAHRMGLPCNDPTLITARRDKAAMRAAVARAGLRSPHFAPCRRFADVLAFMATGRYPVMLKTPQGAGTNHVYRCQDPAALARAFETIMSAPDLFGNRPEHAVIEDYIGGTEYSVDLYFDRHGVRVVCIYRYDKIDTPFADNLYHAMWLESTDSPELQPAIAYAIAVAKAVGVRLGPAHVELKIDADGPVLIEIGARLTGAGIPLMCKNHSTFNPYTALLGAYLGAGDASGPVRFHKHVTIACVPTTVAGRISAIHGMTSIVSLASYQSHTLGKHVGDTITPSTEMGDIPLMVWLAHDDAQVLARDVRQVQTGFSIVCEPVAPAVGHLDRHTAVPG